MKKIKNRILESLLSGDHRSCSKFVNDLIDSGIPVKEIYEDYLKLALYEVGELWEQNKISVATEHLASAIVESLLNEIGMKTMPSAPLNRKVIVTCLENESHQIGARMVSDIFEMLGWNVKFLGANTPMRDLVNFIELVKPETVAISVSIYFHLPTLEKTLNLIRREFPDLPVIIGGQAFVRGGVETLRKYNKVVYLSGLDGIEQFIRNF